MANPTITGYLFNVSDGTSMIDQVTIGVYQTTDGTTLGTKIGGNASGGQAYPLGQAYTINCTGSTGSNGLMIITYQRSPGGVLTGNTFKALEGGGVAGFTVVHKINPVF
jgi:hypothetical protein